MYCTILSLQPTERNYFKIVCHLSEGQHRLIQQTTRGQRQIFYNETGELKTEMVVMH
jgi:hypothetical protein